MTPDVNVSLLDFKERKGNEFVVPNPDGSYTIMINSRLSYSGQLKAYQHALHHIMNNDFEKNNAQSIEYEAHKNSVINNASEPISAQKYLEKVKRLQRERRALKRQMDEYDSRMQFIGFDNDTLFSIAENQYLYGE